MILHFASEKRVENTGKHEGNYHKAFSPHCKEKLTIVRLFRFTISVKKLIISL